MDCGVFHDPKKISFPFRLSLEPLPSLFLPFTSHLGIIYSHSLFLLTYFRTHCNLENIPTSQVKLISASSLGGLSPFLMLSDIPARRPRQKKPPTTTSIRSWLPETEPRSLPSFPPLYAAAYQTCMLWMPPSYLKLSVCTFTSTSQVPCLSDWPNYPLSSPRHKSG